MEQTAAGILVENLKCPSHGGPMGIICTIAMISNHRYHRTLGISSFFAATFTGFRVLSWRFHAPLPFEASMNKPLGPIHSWCAKVLCVLTSSDSKIPGVLPWSLQERVGMFMWQELWISLNSKTYTVTHGNAEYNLCTTMVSAGQMW